MSSDLQSCTLVFPLDDFFSDVCADPVVVSAFVSFCGGGEAIPHKADIKIGGKLIQTNKSHSGQAPWVLNRASGVMYYRPLWTAYKNVGDEQF